MPEYENENRTRQGLDAALRDLLKRKPLAQIRVRELTELCGLRRQSFYYHFKDVYDLFAWCVRRERALLLGRREACLTWQQALLDLLRRTGEERAFYQAVLDQGGQTALGDAVSLEGVLETVQTYYRKRDGGRPDPEADAFRLRCSQAVLLSLLESWVRDELRLSPEEIVVSLEETVERSAAGTLWQTLRERGEWKWTP